MKRASVSFVVLIALLLIPATAALAGERGSSRLGGAANVRMVDIDTAARTVRLRNFGGTGLDISNHWFCSQFSYVQLNTLTVTEGSLNLAAGAEVVVNWFAVNTAPRDMGFFLPIGTFADFGNQSFMVDFLQWGSGGNGREGVAVAKGIWGTGDFIADPAPYTYTGNGNQNGLAFWSGATMPNVRMLSIDTTANTVRIKNFGTAAQNVSNYWLCALLVYEQLINLSVLEGSLNLAPGAEVVVEWSNVLASPRDMGLYIPIITFADFASQAFMADFTQWGAAGLGREIVAVAKGIWGAGDFLDGPSPYDYTGDGTQNGLSFWSTAPVPNVRMLSIDTDAHTVRLRNFGDAAQDVSQHWLCSLFSYAQLNTLVVTEGSLNLGAGAEVVVVWPNVNATPRDMGFYSPINTFADFADAAFMVDFLQWGASGLGRESVANIAGIWSFGDFLDGPAPYDYVGDGMQNGLAFWMVTAVTGAGMVPGTLTIERAGAGMLLLEWPASCLASDTDYAIYEGTIPTFPSHASLACTTGGATSATIAPTAGSTYYLVVPLNATSEGSYGRDSAGAERVTGTTTCEDQLIGACRSR